MSMYQEHALDGASGVELVVALYDGIIRFLYAAAQAVDVSDTAARRVAVRRALDIIIHLQARLRMDVGGKPAEALSEFYASMFAEILQASRLASRPRFDHAIECVREVRDAWKQVVQEEGREALEEVSPGERDPAGTRLAENDTITAVGWTA